jgi:hypothetical protein
VYTGNCNNPRRTEALTVAVSANQECGPNVVSQDVLGMFAIGDDVEKLISANEMFAVFILVHLPSNNKVP